MVIFRLAALLCMVSLYATAAFGKPMDPREATAKEACSTGKVDEGAELLAKLFTETANPVFVFNQGRCYEQNGRMEQAIQRFREYLRLAPKLGGKERKNVDQHIADCQAEVEKQRQAAKNVEIHPAPGQPLPSPQASIPTPPAPPPEPVPSAFPQASAQPSLPTAPASPAQPAPPVLPQAPPQVESAPQAPPSTPVLIQNAPPAENVQGGSGLRTLGIVTGAVGVAAVGAGITFGLLTKSTQDQVESDARNRVYDPDKVSRGHLYETLQWVGYGVGAGAIITGTILILVGHPPAQTSGTVALIPTVGPDQGGFVVQGGF
jgi:hypothetical protein